MHDDQINADAPDAPAGATDWHRLRAYLHSIDGGDFIALATSHAFDQSEGHEDLAEAAAQRGLDDYDGVFWNRQSAERAFHKKELIAPLNLHWVGDHAMVAGRQHARRGRDPHDPHPGAGADPPGLRPVDLASYRNPE